LTGKLYYRRAGRKILPEPMVETYLEVAKALGCGEESPRLELATVEADERSADGVFERLGLNSEPRGISMFPAARPHSLPLSRNGRGE